MDYKEIFKMFVVVIGFLTILGGFSLLVALGAKWVG